MNILIYGANGWIGQQFIKLLTNFNIKFVISNSRAQNTDIVIKEIQANNITHVVSFIGRTHGTIGSKTFPTIDYLEQPGKLCENITDNLFAPVNLALICSKLNIHLTYLGTGCIFKYDDKHPFALEENGFTEEDVPNFFGSGYSTVKGIT